jgi:RNA polymerase sigma-70 factor (ECF subfamily)
VEWGTVGARRDNTGGKGEHREGVRGESPADVLLAHVGWMRELAQALLGDPAAAEDVVQDSLIVAWRSAPQDGGALEPWLSRVLRNLASKRRRSAARRREHEVRGQGPSPEADPYDTAERLDLQRRVLEAVESIEEPLRTTLVLRYFEGRTSAEIAQLQGVPAGTVRWRLSRALEQLRSRLDERHDGSRAAWSALLAPFARMPEPAVAAATLGGLGASTGALLMTVTSKWILAAVLVSLSGAAWWIAQGVEPGAAPLGVAASAPVEAARAELEVPAYKADPAPTNSEARLGVAEAPTQPLESSAPAPVQVDVEKLESRIQMRFVDAAGTPWSDVRASLYVRSSSNELVEQVSSSADGRAELVWRLAPGKYTTAYRVFAQRSGCAGVALVGVVEPGAATSLGDIVLGPGARIVGRVLDENGAALAGATVGLAPEELLEPDLEFLARQGDEEEFRAAPTQSSGERGEFEMSVKPGRWRVWGHAKGRRYAWSEPLEVALGADAPEVTLVVPQLRSTDTIGGRVLLPDGAPAPNATLFVHYFGRSRTGSYLSQTDAEGRFGLVLLSDGSYSLRARDAANRFEDAVALEVSQGTNDLELRLALRDDLELVVRDSAGAAIEGVAVKAEAISSPADVRLDASLRDVGGKLSIHRPSVGFTLEVSAKGYLAQQARFDAPQSAPAKLEFTLVARPTLRGRVLAEGAPLGGLYVTALKEVAESTHVRDGFPARWLATPSGVTTTDDGEFVLEIDGDESWYVRVDGGERFAAAIVGPFHVARLPAAPLEIELDEGGAIEGLVVDSTGAAVEGAIVGAHCGDASPRTQRTDANGRYRFERLTPGSWHVLLRDEELRSDWTTTMTGAPAKPIPWNCEVRTGRATRLDLTLPAGN